MINVSNEFKQLMQERTDFKCLAQINFADGRSLELDETRFSISNNTFTDAAETDGFPLGVAVSRTMQIELMNNDDFFGDYSFVGARILLKLSFELSATTESFNIGYFTVLDPETYGETVIITAQDDMYKTDKPYTTSLTYPASLQQIFQEACSACDLPYSSAMFNNSGYTVSAPPDGDYTYRQIFGYIAMLAGGNARISRDGYMQILTYDFDVSGHSLANWINLKTDTDDITITGVETKTEDDSKVTVGNAGYVLSLENPFFSGKEETALTAIAAKVVGATFRKFEGDYIGYPLAEFMDNVTVADRKGNEYTSFITDYQFVFNGQTTMSNSAQSTLRNSRSYVSDSTKAIIEAQKIVNKERTEREKAVEQLAQALENSSGMYSSTVVQPDGSSIRYLHDKQTLEESTNIIKVTSEAIGFSTDGGKTYPFGLQLNGDTITRILAAEGINADWITTGSFQVKNDAGAVIFSADKDTGTVSIQNCPITTISSQTYLSSNYTNSDLTRCQQIISGSIAPTTADFAKYDFNKDGKITGTDFVLVRNIINNGDLKYEWKLEINPNDRTQIFRIWRELSYANETTVTTEIISVNSDGVKFNNNSDPLSDYIVEQGTSGIWTYRKWASGVAECWGQKQITSYAMTKATYNHYYGTAITENYPFSFVSIIYKSSEASDSKTSVVGVQRGTGADASLTQIGNTYPISFASQTVDITLNHYVKGTWK